jgi:hypothetical protein
MEEWPPIWRATANKLNKQSLTADEGWSSGLGDPAGSKATAGIALRVTGTHKPLHHDPSGGLEYAGPKRIFI